MTFLLYMMQIADAIFVFLQSLLLLCSRFDVEIFVRELQFDRIFFTVIKKKNKKLFARHKTLNFIQKYYNYDFQ